VSPAGRRLVDRGCSAAAALLLAAGAALGGLGAAGPAAAATGRAPDGRAAGPAAVDRFGADPAAVAVRAENARPGWARWMRARFRTTAPGLDGYLDQVSVRPGQTFGLKIDAEGPVLVNAVRIGWYGGAGGRTVWSATVTAHRQPAAVELMAAVPGSGGLSRSRAVRAPWSTTAEVDTTGWPQGHYLLRLDAGRASRLLPLTVRSERAAGRLLLLVNATMTWQAYNLWGGRSLYRGPGGGPASYPGRSLAVSYDRPYADGAGSGKFLSHDAPVVQLAESLGLPLAWATDYDLALDPHLLDGAAGVVFGAHAEYWTPAERAAVIAATGRGTNLAVLGANTGYWRVRLAGMPRPPDRLGERDGRPADPFAVPDARPRVLVGTKDAGLDPLAARDPAGATVRFWSAPAAQPEEALAGLRYDCFPADTAWTVTDPTWFGYAGTGVRAGERLAHLVGAESDRLPRTADRGVPRQVLAYTGFRCGDGRSTYHAAVYRSLPSGAGVFAAGTMRWPCAVFGRCRQVRDARTAFVVRAVSTNLLREFAVPRAGRRHPATDTAPRFPLR
jgi:hypothetical protein